MPWGADRAIVVESEAQVGVCIVDQEGRCRADAPELPALAVGVLVVVVGLQSPQDDLVVVGVEVEQVVGVAARVQEALELVHAVEDRASGSGARARSTTSSTAGVSPGRSRLGGEGGASAGGFRPVRAQ